MKPFNKLFSPLTSSKALSIIIIVGFVVFVNSLFNGFVGDDSAQAIANLFTDPSAFSNFFSGGSFSNGGGQQIAGIYYKPLLNTHLSLIFSIFGDSPASFHFFQIMLHILNSSILFLFFSRFFKKELALLLSLVFLIHPINSEAVFYVSNAQETLFFLFGILALYLATIFESKKQLAIIVLLLLCSLLSKETGILFVIISVIYMVFIRKKYVILFIISSLVMFASYLLLRMQATGLLEVPLNAPIAQLSLGERLLHIPSIFFFYVYTFLFPFKLAASYQWTNEYISFGGFFLPVIINSVVILLISLFAVFLYKRFRNKYLPIYIFFCLWFFLGIGLHLQLFPLDATVAERWFYFP
ncbi:MAG: glycosyltransferase family 39 protein, partial [Patescibacteria group bacterium]